MQISKYLSNGIKRAAQARIEKLQEIQARSPESTVEALLISGEQQRIEHPLKGIGKIDLFGHLEFTNAEWKTGKGGKMYCRFNIEGQRDVCYVNGKFGWYLYQEN